MVINNPKNLSKFCSFFFFFLVMIHRSPNMPIMKKKWTEDEDELLIKYIKKTGPSNWDHIAKHVPGRSGKQCRERWITVLDPKVNHDSWTPEEDALLLKFQKGVGNKWSCIADMLPGRTAVSVKNRFKFLVRRQTKKEKIQEIQPAEQTAPPSVETSDIEFNIPMHLRIKLF